MSQDGKGFLICWKREENASKINFVSLCDEEIADKEGELDPGREEAGSHTSIFSERQGPYTQRELFFQQQEASSSFTFEYVENNGQPQNNVWYAESHLQAFIVCICLRPFSSRIGGSFSRSTCHQVFYGF